MKDLIIVIVAIIVCFVLLMGALRFKCEREWTTHCTNILRLTT